MFGLVCEDFERDSSWKEKRSRAGVDETSLADSYIGSSSVPAKFSFAYFDGGGGSILVKESDACCGCGRDWSLSMSEIEAECSSRVAMCF